MLGFNGESGARSDAIGVVARKFGFRDRRNAVPTLRVYMLVNLELIEALKEPNTHRKYEAVLERFLDFFRDQDTIEKISADDLTRFIVALQKDHGLGGNTVLHNAVIIAQFLKRHGGAELPGS